MSLAHVNYETKDFAKVLEQYLDNDQKKDIAQMRKLKVSEETIARSIYNTNIAVLDGISTGSIYYSLLKDTYQAPTVGMFLNADLTKLPSYQGICSLDPSFLEPIQTLQSKILDSLLQAETKTFLYGPMTEYSMEDIADQNNVFLGPVSRKPKIKPFCWWNVHS